MDLSQDDLGEGLGRADKRLDKISAALCGLRPRYIAHGLVARTPSILFTIITSSYYNNLPTRMKPLDNPTNLTAFGKLCFRHCAAKLKYWRLTQPSLDVAHA